jgi:hypothetical protein
MTAPEPHIHHDFVSAKSDGSDDTQVQPSAWDAPHIIDDKAIPTDKLDLGTNTALVGAAGAGAALPATPEGYIEVGDFLVPYYAKHVAAPTLRSVGAVGSWNSGTSRLIAKPAGLTVGDLVIIPFVHRWGGLGLPSGFADPLGQQTSGNWDLVFIWKIADSSDVAGSGFTFTGGNYNSIEQIGVALAFETAGEPIGAHSYSSALSGISGWTTAAIPIAVGSVLSTATGLVTAPSWANYSGITWGSPVVDFCDTVAAISFDFCVYVGSPISASGESGSISNPQSAWAMALAVPYSG